MEKRCRKNIPFPRKQPLLPRRGRRNELRTCRDKRTGVPSPRGFRPSEKKFSLGPPAADHPAHPPYSLRYRRLVDPRLSALSRNGPCRQPGHDVEVTIRPRHLLHRTGEELERLGAASDADKSFCSHAGKRFPASSEADASASIPAGFRNRCLTSSSTVRPCLKE